MTKQLLILDIDETLVYGTKEPLAYQCDFQTGPYFVYRRPFLKEFLECVVKWYHLAVWSSASIAYVQDVVRHLFPEPGLLQFVWSRERCTQSYDPELMDFYWLKNLKKVKRLGYRLEKVIMLDDSPEKLQRNYGNHIKLMPFLGQPDDTELHRIIPFLEWLHGKENFRSIEKRFWRAFQPITSIA